MVPSIVLLAIGVGIVVLVLTNKSKTKDTLGAAGKAVKGKLDEGKQAAKDVLDKLNNKFGE